MIDILKRLLVFIISFELVFPPHLYAYTGITAEVLDNREHFSASPEVIRIHKGFLDYSNSLPPSTSEQCRETTPDLIHEKVYLSKNSKGIYELQVNPEALQKRSCFMLIDNDHLIGQVVSDSGQVNFLGAVGCNFELVTALTLASLSISVGGDFYLPQSLYAAHGISFQGKSLLIAQSLRSQGEIQLNAIESIINKGRIEAQNRLIATFKRFTNSGGTIISPEQLRFEGDFFHSPFKKGAIESDKVIYFNLNNSFKNNSLIEAKGALVIKASDMDNQEILSAKNLDIHAKKISNSGAIQSGLIRAQYNEFRNMGGIKVEGDFLSQGQKFENSGKGNNKGLIVKGIYQALIDTYIDNGFNQWDSFAEIQSKKITLDGRYECHRALFEAQDSLTALAGSYFATNYSIILKSGSGLRFNGKTYLTPLLKKTLPQREFTKRLEELTNRMPYGIFVEGKDYIWQKGDITSDSSSISYLTKGELDLKGKTQSGFFQNNRTEINALRSIISGSLISHGGLNLQIEKEVELTGTIMAQNLNILAETITILGQARAQSAALKAKQDIHITSSGLLKVDEHLHLDAQGEIVNKGEIEAKSLVAQATGIRNTGTISVSQAAHFKADLYFINWLRGQIHAEDITIDAALSLNFLGLMSASRNLTINSLIDANCFGIEAARHFSINCLVHLPLKPLYMPSLDTATLFTWASLKNGAQSAAMTLCSPELKSLLNLGLAAQRVYYQLPTLWNQYQGLNEASRFSDYLPLIVGAKDLAYSIHSTYEAFQPYTTGEASLNIELPTSDSLANVLSLNTLNQVRSSALETLKPSVRIDALYSRSSGIIISGNVYKRGIYADNDAYVIASNYTNDAYYATNTGYIRAERATFNNKFFHNQSKVSTLAETSVQAETILTELGSTMGADRVLLKGLNINHQGAAHGQTSTYVEAKQNLTTGTSSTLTGKDVETKGQTVTHGGKIEATQRSTLKAEEKLITAVGSSVMGAETYLEGTNIDHQGTAHGQTSLYVEAKQNLTTGASSTLTGKDVEAKGQTVTHGGKIEAIQRSTLKAEEKLITAVGSSVMGAETYLEGTNVDHQGAAYGRVITHVAAKEELSTGKQSAMTGGTVIATGKNITHAGKVVAVKDSLLKAEDKLSTEEGAVTQGENVSLLGVKVKHKGNARATGDTGTAIVFGSQETTLKSGSKTQGQFVITGKTQQEVSDASGSKVVETLSQNTTIEKDARVEAAQWSSVEGVEGSIAGDINTVHADFKFQKEGKFLAPEKISSATATVEMGTYEGGGQGVIDLSNRMTNVKEAHFEAPNEDFHNNIEQTIQGNRSINFRSIDNKAKIVGTDSLQLNGKDYATTSQDIFAPQGVSFTSSSGKTTLNNGAVVHSNGFTYVKGEQGVFLESRLTDDYSTYIRGTLVYHYKNGGQTLKRAGILGENVLVESGADLVNIGGQIKANKYLETHIKGDQRDLAIECANGTKVINPDGTISVQNGSRRAPRTFASAQYIADFIDENIEGKLYTEAGFYQAHLGGTLQAKQGIEALTMKSIYTLRDKDRGLFSTTYYSWQETDFYRPTFVSDQGAINLIATQGGINFEGGVWQTAQTSLMYAQGKISLNAATSRENFSETTSYLGGLAGKDIASGYNTNVRTTDFVGLEKIHIYSEKDNVEGQAPTIIAAQGGSIRTPNGIISLQPLTLDSEYNYKSTGLRFSSNAESPLAPMLRQADNLRHMKDNPAAFIFNSSNLAQEGTTTLTQGVQAFNNGSVDSFIFSHSNLDSFNLGYYNTKSYMHGQDQIAGKLVAGGEFEIQTKHGGSTDLSGVNSFIEKLVADTDRIKFQGLKQTFNYEASGKQINVSTRLSNLQNVTVAANEYDSSQQGLQYNKTNHVIDHIEFKRDDTIVDIHNADVHVAKTSGAQFKVNIQDNQNTFHSEDHQAGFSGTFNFSTGVPILVDGRPNFSDNEYTSRTTTASNVWFGEAPNLVESKHERLPDFSERKSRSAAFEVLSSVPFTQLLDIPATLNNLVENIIYDSSSSAILPVEEESPSFYQNEGHVDGNFGQEVSSAQKEVYGPPIPPHLLPEGDHSSLNTALDYTHGNSDLGFTPWQDAQLKEDPSYTEGGMCWLPVNVDGYYGSPLNSNVCYETVGREYTDFPTGVEDLLKFTHLYDSTVPNITQSFASIDLIEEGIEPLGSIFDFGMPNRALVKTVGKVAFDYGKLATTALANNIIKSSPKISLNTQQFNQLLEVFKKKLEGGSYGSLLRKPGIHRHHAPANTTNGLPSTQQGPAIQMKIEHHKQTASFGNSKAAQQYRKEIAELISQNKQREAMTKEIKDIKSIVGSESNQAIKDMLDYAKKIGYLDKK